MLPSAIEQRLLAYIDQWADTFEDVNGLKTVLTDIARKASVDYWEKLADQWGRDGRVNDEISPIVKSFSVASPGSNQLDISSSSSDLPSYDRFGFVTATFVSDGVTYTEVCTYWNPEDRKSPYSQPTLRYPKYDIQDGIIQIYPITTACTLATGQYLRTYYLIDFDSSTDVPISDKNAEGIIARAIEIIDAKVREPEAFQMDSAIQQKEATE